jgi:hypothetical protein
MRELTDPMDPSELDHSLLGRHTYFCALTTRDGLCDCIPSNPVTSARSSVEPVGANGVGRTDRRRQEPSCGFKAAVVLTLRFLRFARIQC